MTSRSHHISGNDLLARIDRQGSKAFDELFKEFYASLCLFTARYTNDDESARDIVSELFLTLWKERDSLTDVEDVRAYLYSAARNKSLNYLKHLEVVKKHESDYLHTAKFELPSIDQSIYDAETIRFLYQAVSALPSECRQVVTLTLEGFSTTEIASKLSVSPAAVSNQKARAIRLLRFKIPAMLWFVMQYVLG